MTGLPDKISLLTVAYHQLNKGNTDEKTSTKKK